MHGIISKVIGVFYLSHHGDQIGRIFANKAILASFFENAHMYIRSPIFLGYFLPWLRLCINFEKNMCWAMLVHIGRFSTNSSGRLASHAHS
jgi:hypothetical protein